MKLPTKVFGQNKIRDAKILMLWKEGVSPEEMVVTYGIKLTARRINEILYNNKAILRVDKQWEEAKQIQRIINHLRDNPKTKKDPLEWEQLLDGKINAKSEVSESSNQTKVIIIRETNGNQDTSREVSRQVSVVRV